MNKDLWVKLSGSINYFIKDLWKEQLLRSSEDLLSEFIEYAFMKEDDTYKYLNKKTHEYISLDIETMERVQKAFIERVDKKKAKYADELEDLLKAREKNNVVDFFKYKD